MNPTTHPKLIFIVVGTAALLAVVFFGALVAMLFLRPDYDERVLNALVTAGTTTMAFLFGVLVNTRTVTPPVSEATRTTTTTERTDPTPAP